MQFSKLTTWIGLTGVTVALAGCPGDDSGEDTASNPTTVNNPTTTGPASTGPASTGPASTGPGSTSEADSSGGGSSSEGGDETTTTGDEVCDPPCLEGQMCVGGQCFGDPPPDMSDYGPCDMCAAGEAPLMITGLEGCFCSPGCDGAMSMCPAPNEGMGMGACVLGPQGADPVQCALLCQLGMDQCPTGATCQDTGQGIGICTHPA